MISKKTGNQKRKYACNRYEDIDKYIWKVFDTFGHDEKIEILVYWTKKLQKERAEFRKKAIKYDELIKTPTFEECVKEWNDWGYEFYKGKNHIHFRQLNEDGLYDEYIFHPIQKYYVANDTKVTFERLQLIIKTLKALGDKVNE